MIRIILVFCIFFFMSAMALGGGRAPKDATGRMIPSQEDLNQKHGTPEGPSSTAPIPPGRVRVYKPDGSLQCAMGRGISLDEMAKELKDLTIYRSEKKMDGLLRIMQCGAPTGMCNVYEIERVSLQRAIEFGFREWTFADSP